MENSDKPNNKGGAPKGNQNNLRHGLRAGQLPRDAKHIEWAANRLRRQIEAAVIEAKGEVSLTDAAMILTVLRWETHGMLCRRWLTKEGKDLKPMEKMQFSRDIARASAERDKALAMLGLDKKKSLSFAVVEEQQ